jgi:hypothetical protein
MRRLTAWIGGVASGVVAYRFWRRHSQAAEAPEPTPVEPDDRAEELRAKLAETRSAEPVVEATPPAPVAEEEPSAEPDSPEDRRQRVHEEGRAALDEMKSDNGGVAPS